MQELTVSFFKTHRVGQAYEQALVPAMLLFMAGALCGLKLALPLWFWLLWCALFTGGLLGVILSAH